MRTIKHTTNVKDCIDNYTRLFSFFRFDSIRKSLFFFVSCCTFFFFDFCSLHSIRTTRIQAVRYSVYCNLGFIASQLCSSSARLFQSVLHSWLFHSSKVQLNLLIIWREKKEEKNKWNKLVNYITENSKQVKIMEKTKFKKCPTLSV